MQQLALVCWAACQGSFTLTLYREQNACEAQGLQELSAAVDAANLLLEEDIKGDDVKDEEEKFE